MRSTATLLSLVITNANNAEYSPFFARRHLTQTIVAAVLLPFYILILSEFRSFRLLTATRQCRTSLTDAT